MDIVWFHMGSFLTWILVKPFLFSLEILHNKNTISQTWIFTPTSYWGSSNSDKSDFVLSMTPGVTFSSHLPSIFLLLRDPLGPGWSSHSGSIFLGLSGALGPGWQEFAPSTSLAWRNWISLKLRFELLDVADTIGGETLALMLGGWFFSDETPPPIILPAQSLLRHHDTGTTAFCFFCCQICDNPQMSD